jgi:hypothetical protein
MNTIRQWIKKYGMEELLPKLVRVETTVKIDELKEAKKRIRYKEKYGQYNSSISVCFSNSKRHFIWYCFHSVEG